MTISDVLRAIKKHWIVEIVLFCVVVGVVAGKTFTTTPVYTASTEVLAQYNSAQSQWGWGLYKPATIFEWYILSGKSVSGSRAV